MKRINVAIDGPSGAGKSSLARYAAGVLGYIYVDTGALYRAVGLAAHRRGISKEDTQGIIGMLDDITVGFESSPEGQRTVLCGEDVSELIRNETVSMYASAVSAIPKVRQFLLDTQRRIAAEADVIMDGRDIATVVLPNADVKIFLTASVEERAMRRYLQSGGEVDLETLTELIKQRDKQDSEREIAPLRRHEDAILLDTTGNTLEQSRELLVNTIKERIGK